MVVYRIGMEPLWLGILVFNTSLWAFTLVGLLRFRHALLQRVANDLGLLVIDEVRKQDDRLQRRVERAQRTGPNATSTEPEQEEDELHYPPPDPLGSPKSPPTGGRSLTYPAGVSLRALGLPELPPATRRS